jgi:hypothetical protein
MEDVMRGGQIGWDSTTVNCNRQKIASACRSEASIAAIFVEELSSWSNEERACRQILWI